MAATPLRPRLHRLFRDRTASVGLEMALVTPLLMLMLLGFYEAYSYIRTAALVERAAVTVANTMARQTASLVDCSTSASSLNLGTYMLAATLVAEPAPLARNGEVIVSAVDWPANRQTPRVAWQRRSTFNDEKHSSALGTQATDAKLPDGLAAAIVQGGGDTVLVAEVFYRFAPFAMTAPFWSEAPGLVTISRTAYFRARTANLATLAAGCGSPLPTPPA